jgi:Trp operon repressor
MKRKPEDLDVKSRKHCLDLLVTATKDVATHSAYEDFFKGLLTPSEQIMLGRRIWIARLLLARKSYQEIGAELCVGPNTIRRTELWLRGQLPDYEKILIEAEEAATQLEQKRMVKNNPLDFAALKKRYPLHFLLFPMPKK